MHLRPVRQQTMTRQARIGLRHSLARTSKIGARVKFMGNNTIGTAKDNGCPVIEDERLLGSPLFPLARLGNWSDVFCQSPCFDGLLCRLTVGIKFDQPGLGLSESDRAVQREHRRHRPRRVADAGGADHRDRPRMQEPRHRRHQVTRSASHLRRLQMPQMKLAIWEVLASRISEARA